MPDIECNLLAAEIEKSVGTGAQRPDRYVSLADYAPLARRLRWRQRWDWDARTLREEAREREGVVWSDALEAAFREHSAVRIPASLGMIYLDRPLLLGSGQALQAESGCVIRQIPGEKGSPMLMNRAGAAGVGRDRDILVEGGVWDGALNDGRGRIGLAVGSYAGALSFGRIDGLTLRGMTWRDIEGYGCQIVDATRFRVEHIRFEHTADGVHIDGPASDGVIRDLAGHTTDDPVSLTAWDWEVGSTSFGAIRRVLVEDVELQGGHTWAEIRLLAGVKRFADGTLLDCGIGECVLRRIRHIHTFKIYEQPSWYDVRDRSAGPGRLGRIFFRDILVGPFDLAGYYDRSSDALFDIGSDVELLSVRGVEYPEPPGSGGSAPYLVGIGPKSTVIPVGGVGDCNPGPFKDLFNPESCPVVDRLEIAGVRVAGRRLGADEIARLVNVRSRLPQELPVVTDMMPECSGHGTLRALECR